MQLNVQFKDSTEGAICAFFAAAQNPSDFPNSGTVDASDARWKTFYESVPGSRIGMPTPTTPADEPAA
ncbi:hypothetical protein [Burkholderia gladioli]|uniref:hypothetical protein n=1 Tax=Burkholderia gladioli TaxID=28095 RepID=UPI0016407FE2|nr:hypothetical protein [Burkholderia gladioli]